MWIDDRGSEILGLAECRRLLAVGAKQHRHGHLGIPGEGAPVVEPLDYAVHGHDVIVRIGEALFRRMVGQLVAFQVDGSGDQPGHADVEGERQWSVLVQGLAHEEDGQSLGSQVPVPSVANPGARLLRIRADVVTGRRLRPRPPTSDPAGHPPS